MQNIKNLIVWAEAQYKKQHRLSEQCWDDDNNYIVCCDFIKDELLPKLKEVLHVSSNMQSTKRKKKVKD